MSKNKNDHVLFKSRFYWSTKLFGLVYEVKLILKIWCIMYLIYNYL